MNDAASGKKIWLFNHYAVSMYQNAGGRHYWFAQNLIKKGYGAVIFCANTFHQREESIAVPKGKYSESSSGGIPFVFVKTVPATKNGIKRVINMLLFAFNLLTAAKKYARLHGKPDIILASSVHPFTLMAGLRIAKKFKIPCICEVRDLWPESFLAFGIVKKRSLLSLLMPILYRFERRIYRKADRLIFTMEGGRDYIIEKKWDKQSGGPIDLGKVHHINNGVDLKAFIYNRDNVPFSDEHLDNPELFKAVYTGAIRAANDIDSILDAAKLTDDPSIIYLIWGQGDREEALKKRCALEGINNVVFKGLTKKRTIPAIVSRADVTLLNYADSTDSAVSSVTRYGGSHNKMFEYFAAGKPVIQNYKIAYGLVERYDCGVVVPHTPEALAGAVKRFSEMPADEYAKYCENAKNAAKDYDFEKLTDDLIDVLLR